MSGRLLFLFLLFWSNLSFTQELHFSRPFPTVSKNHPVQIQQSGKEHFYVLRYNRKAHDLTVECRSAETAEILFFTPLRLDSINSKHFNYTNLDYLLIEYENALYFVFERELNNSKTVFCKRIDRLGKSGPFVEILNLPRQLHWQDFDLVFNSVNNGILILESVIHLANQSVKKSIACYDLVKKRMLWSITLPIENAFTGSSEAFAIDSSAVYYIQVRSELAGYNRKYENHRQLMIPEYFHDSLYLVKLSINQEEFRRKAFLSNLNHINSLRLHCDSGNLRIYAQTSRTVAGENEPQLQVYSASFETWDLEQNSEQFTTLDEQIKKRLTYFDGTDSEQAADKNFSFLQEHSFSNRYFMILERKEGGIYKELMLTELNRENGRVLNQYLLPRRMLSSETWSKYADIGEALCQFDHGQMFLYMAEPSDNLSLDPNKAVYYNLKKKSNLRHCDLIQYRFLQGNRIEKKRLFQNEDFDFIPVRFRSTGNMIFYFTNGKQEKFAWLKD